PGAQAAAPVGGRPALLLHDEPLRAGEGAGARHRERHAAELGPTPGPGAAAVAAGHDDHARPRRGGDGGLRPGLRRPPLLAVRAAGRRLRSGLGGGPGEPRRPNVATLTMTS